MTSYLQSLLDRYSKLAVYDRPDATNGAVSVQSQNINPLSLLQSLDILADTKSGNVSPAMQGVPLSISTPHWSEHRYRPQLRYWDPAKYRDCLETQFSREYLTDSISKEIERSDSYYATVADAYEKFAQKTANLTLQSLDPEGTGHGQSVQTEDARNAGQGASNRRTTKVERNHKKSNRTNQKGKTKMSRLPHVKGSKRGPKRIAMARKIAKAGHKNWHARASMWLDGLSGTHA